MPFFFKSVSSFEDVFKYVVQFWIMWPAEGAIEQEDLNKYFVTFDELII